MAAGSVRGVDVVMARGAGTAVTPTLIAGTCPRRAQAPRTAGRRYRSCRHPAKDALDGPRRPAAPTLRAAVAAVTVAADLTSVEVRCHESAGFPGFPGDRGNNAGSAWPEATPALSFQSNAMNRLFISEDSDVAAVW